MRTDNGVLLDPHVNVRLAAGGVLYKPLKIDKSECPSGGVLRAEADRILKQRFEVELGAWVRLRRYSPAAQ